MKNIVTFMGAVACAAALTACGGGGDGDTVATSPSNDGSTPTTSTGSDNTGNSSPGSASTGSNGGSSSSGDSNSGSSPSSQIASYTVTPSVSGTGGAISPSSAAPVQSGANASFTLTPDSGYAVSSVNGTCGGTLSGNTYTTNAIIQNCTVVASFVAVNSGGGSIAACFSASKTVSFAITNIGISGTAANAPASSTVGPGTVNGQSVTVQTIIGKDESSFSTYSAVTAEGVSGWASVDTAASVEYPLNMQPGQYVDYASSGDTISRDTLIEIGSITLGGKTFTNACHFRETGVNYDGNPTDSWVAPGYGVIYDVANSSGIDAFGWEYASDL
jgi:hypothetical protein